MTLALELQNAPPIKKLCYGWIVRKEVATAAVGVGAEAGGNKATEKRVDVVIVVATVATGFDAEEKVTTVDLTKAEAEAGSQPGILLQQRVKPPVGTRALPTEGGGRGSTAGDHGVDGAAEGGHRRWYPRGTVNRGHRFQPGLGCSLRRCGAVAGTRRRATWETPPNEGMGAKDVAAGMWCYRRGRWRRRHGRR